jgi:hypothetical protein
MTASRIDRHLNQTLASKGPSTHDTTNGRNCRAMSGAVGVGYNVRAMPICSTNTKPRPSVCRVIPFQRPPCRPIADTDAALRRIERQLFVCARMGIVTATPACLGLAQAIWVRDGHRQVVSQRKWNDLPVRVVGELYVVSHGA